MDSKENKGCGCGSIPLVILIPAIGGIGWWLSQQGDLRRFLPAQLQTSPSPISVSIPSPSSIAPTSPSPRSPAPIATASPSVTEPVEVSPTASPSPPAFQAAWEQKVMRGIYISRYQITNNADEATIRNRVRAYKAQGINTLLHGVWGNGCTMYHSPVMQKVLGFDSCPNLYQDQWLDWTIDEAHKQGMQVHAYFERGIKIDKTSPIYNIAVSRNWLVPGIDKTYPGIDHYVLDVSKPEVASFLVEIMGEFVQKYPKIDALQWDDYLAYHADLPGKIDRTAQLTTLVQQMVSKVKQANPKVSFDICHHNPYWAKRYFAADWQKWGVDRVFIQAYNETNFAEELNYAQQYAGVAISERQLQRIPALLANPKIKSILLFALDGDPAKAATNLQKSIHR
jgi:uncharacterized lipoprotein YddW (UPF0748 family)